MTDSQHPPVHKPPTFDSETKVRIRTGVIGGAIFLALLLFGSTLGITIITAVMTLAMVWELAQIFFILPDRQEKTKALLGGAWLIIFVNMLVPRSMVECLVIAVLLYFTYYLAVATRHIETLKEHFLELVMSNFILVYVVTFMVFLPLIRASVQGLHWTILFFLIVWTCDTGAYFAGRKYGKTKLYPLISPGKTMEGALGGIATSFIITILYKLVFFKQLGILGAFVTPLVVAVISQVGDLCESFLKRAYRIKDTSRLLPGHGGMLDRFDGVLFALPVMYFCVKTFSA